MAGDGGGRAALPAADCHCSPGLGHLGLGASLGLSQRRRLWAREQGSRVTVRELEEPGAAEGGGGQHTEGPGSCRCVLSPRSHQEGHLPAGSGHRLQTTAFTGHPPPLRSEARAGGGSEDSAPSGNVCWMMGGSRVGRDGPSGGRTGFSCSQRETGGHRYYCSAGRGGPGMRGARRDL